MFLYNQTDCPMRITKQIPISTIRMDRHPLHPSTLSLLDHLRRGGTVPPIKVEAMSDGTYRIRDGRHRITAFKLLGRKFINAKFFTSCKQSNN